MEPMVADFRREIAGLEPGPAEFRLFSTVLGREVDGAEMTVDYWAGQICSPVLFFDAVQAALRTGRANYLAEAGPESTLLTLARQGGLPPQTRSLTLCSGPDSDGTELLGVPATMMRDGLLTRSGGAVRRAGRPAAADPALCLRYRPAGSGSTARSPTAGSRAQTAGRRRSRRRARTAEQLPPRRRAGSWR